MKRISLIDVVAGFPAHSALFTTFSLTLTWFEAYLLRRLERAGVRDIAILADPIGVASAVTEGLAAGPGLRYSLEAVRLDDRDGVFHPKLAVLWNNDEALIAVGSGNLTFAGMMRNLEQWDVLGTGPDVPASCRCPEAVASKLADFLDNLQILVAQGARATALLESGARALRRLAPSLPVDDSVRWLDTSDESIGSQMKAVIPAGSGRRLQVLSPFHADGAATRRLASELGASAVDILYTAGQTSFPFEAPRPDGSPTLRTRALQFQRKEARRPLHAKVVRLNDRTHDWLLAGSANATTRGMWSSENIEVNLLRRAPAGTFDTLLANEAGDPVFVKADDSGGSRSPLTILWARATRDRIDLELTWSGSDRAPEHVQVRPMVDQTAWVEATWPSDGRLRVPAPERFDLIRPVAMRVEAVTSIDGNRSRAVAWIAFDTLLDASPRFRAAVRSWRALLDRESEGGLSSDDRTLLQLFAAKRAQVLSALAKTRRAPDTNGPDDEGAEAEEVPVPLELLRSLAGGGARTNAIGSERSSGANVIARATAELNRALSVRTNGERTTPGERSKAPKKLRRLDKKSREAIEAFQDSFLSKARELDGSAVEHPEEAVLYAAFCGRLAAAFWLRDADRRGFWVATSALTRVLLSPRTRVEKGPLLPALDASPEALSLLGETLTLSIALLSWKADGGTLTGTDTLDPKHLLRGSPLRRALATLDRLVGEPLPLPPVPGDVLDVLPEDHDLPAHLERLRASPVPGSAAERLLPLLKKPSEVDSAVLRALSDPEREALRTARGPRPPIVTRAWKTTCPGCQSKLPTVASSRLQRWELALCNCGRWLLPVAPT